MRSTIYDYSVEELQYLLDTSNGYADVLRKIGLCQKGGNQETLKSIIIEYNLDVSKLNENRSKLFSNTNSRKPAKLEDIFDGKYPNYSSSKLLKRLVENGMKEYKCERCGISEWMGEKIALHLHHKDGNHYNNKFENLKILCPNCHSQTDTFAGKTSGGKRRYHLDKPHIQNKEPKPRKPIPIEREDLKFKIRTQSFLSIGKEFGLSDNMIRKWCKRYNLPFRKKDIDSYTEEEWSNV